MFVPFILKLLYVFKIVFVSFFFFFHVVSFVSVYGRQNWFFNKFSVRASSQLKNYDNKFFIAFSHICKYNLLCLKKTILLFYWFKLLRNLLDGSRSIEINDAFTCRESTILAAENGNVWKPPRINNYLIS